MGPVAAALHVLIELIDIDEQVIVRIKEHCLIEIGFGCSGLTPVKMQPPSQVQRLRIRRLQDQLVIDRHGFIRIALPLPAIGEVQVYIALEFLAL